MVVNSENIRAPRYPATEKEIQEAFKNAERPINWFHVGDTVCLKSGGLFSRMTVRMSYMQSSRYVGPIEKRPKIGRGTAMVMVYWFRQDQVLEEFFFESDMLEYN